MSDTHNELYELSYLVPSTVSEADAQATVERLKNAVTNAGGDITSESAPKVRQLAYSIAQKTESKREWFENAYFGWFAFWAEPDAVQKVREEVASDEGLLRHLVIKTTQVAVEYRLAREAEGDEDEDEEEEVEADEDEDSNEEGEEESDQSEEEAADVSEEASAEEDEEKQE